MAEGAWLDEAVKLLVWTRDNLALTPGVPIELVEEADRLRVEVAGFRERIIKSRSFTSPGCGRTSHNLNDVRDGYCGACHDWTRRTA